MRTFRFVAVQALTVAGILSLPVFAQQTQPLQTPEVSQAQVAPATPVKEPVTEAVKASGRIFRPWLPGDAFPPQW